MIRHPPYLAFWAEYNVYVKSNPPPDKEKTELPLSVFSFVRGGYGYPYLNKSQPHFFSQKPWGRG